MQSAEEVSLHVHQVYKPLITVAVTSYNSSNFIVQCILSILRQSYKNYEIILVDDCSADGTIEVVKRLVIKNKLEDKLKIFTHSFNCGYGKSLKDAVELGNGELIVIVDSDDALAHGDAFKMLVETHYKNPEASLVYSDYWECDEQLKPFKLMKCTTFKPGQTYLGKFDGDRYLGNNVRVSHVKCFKREFYNKTEGVDSSLIKNVDKDLVLKLEEVGKLCHIPVGLYWYRIHLRSITKMWVRQSNEYKRKVREAKLRMYSNARERRQPKNEDIP